MRLSLIFLLLISGIGFTADPMVPKVPDAVKLVPGKAMSSLIGKKCIVKVETTAKKVTWKIPSGIDAVSVGNDLHVWATEGVYTLTAQVPSGDDVLSTDVVLTVIGPRPPPTPADPPAPVPPTPVEPVVVRSFRVIWFVESGDNIKRSVMNAKSVRDFLNENTTPEDQWVGWREYDPDIPPTNETPIMKKLHATVRPSVTKVPCFAIEVNGKADILDYPATAAEALAILKKYKEGGKK